MRGIDMTDSEDVLKTLEFDPDVIPRIAVERLCEITGATEGRIHKLQAFCEEWTERLSERCERESTKRRRTVN